MSKAKIINGTLLNLFFKTKRSLFNSDRRTNEFMPRHTQWFKNRRG